MASDRDQQQRLEALLEAMEPRVREAFFDAIQRLRGAVSVADLARLIEEGRTQEALDLLRANQAFTFPMSEAIRAAYVGGGGLVRPTLPVTLRGTFGFGMNPRAEAWARDTSSRMIEAVNDNLPEVQALIETGAREGVPPRKTALDIVGRMDRVTGKRTGGLLGLNSNQTDAAIRARGELTRLDVSYFDRKLRDRRFDSTVRKAIEAGKPLSQADIDRIAGRYKDRLLEHRGKVIARTEALNALRAGDHEGWRQLIETGAVSADRVTVKWLAARDARTRDAHTILGDTVVPFGGFFVSPATGALMEHPGDTSHGAQGEDIIQCRCGAVYNIRPERRNG